MDPIQYIQQAVVDKIRRYVETGQAIENAQARSGKGEFQRGSISD